MGSAPLGEASGSGGGLMAWIWEARRDAGVEGWRGGVGPGCTVCEGKLVVVGLGRGEAGTELRSGAMAALRASSP